MYPQVFAMLGFRGKGGPGVGIPENSEFDVAGTFRKREVVTEKRVTEIAKIMWNGSIKVWCEEESSHKETTHLESSNGNFARRELVVLEQKEYMDGNVVTKEGSKNDFVHFKNETGEFSTFV
eukprot:CAMPEP_0204841022 /NCGR_PEP_ID=MMETSP1346-20131115/40172_1 /ASSEMBLY_ACC=CAM_ASM_000771 /TAXON_ID=215587 /ORGANISM="Aplanochytrium stocchinoi, Strain GSBS06" /LENGTH=121 /DNA_ID=CAMNT_0051978851 /DNA_START=51 /DNA_END=413 /DNA_ORIENTATION=-